MDYSFKYGLLKKKRVIVDIGNKRVKLMGVRYQKAEIIISCIGEFCMPDPLEKTSELAGYVSEFIAANHLGRCEVLVSLPSSVVANRIATVKNIKHSALDKHIRTECFSFNRVSEGTHNIDWSYLGDRDENGDTVSYVLIGAVPKSVAVSLYDAFRKRGLRIECISFALCNRIYLSDLLEYRNKIMVDDTRIIAFADGVAVYARDTSTEMVSQDIGRVIEMFEHDPYNATITRIICGGTLDRETVGNLSDTYTGVEHFSIARIKQACGTGYQVTANVNGINSSYNSAVGLAVGAIL